MESRAARRDVSALPKMLYVGGFGRSGSTLVGRVLGEAPGAVCVGETRYLWSRGLVHNVQCGCGRPFRGCSFWGAIGEEAFGGWDHADVDRLVELERITNQLRALPFHQLPALRSGFAAEVEAYAYSLAKIYAAIARVSGAKVIVETSKDPNFALVLTRIPDHDIRIIHLVRDSRAVAYSWTRTKRMSSPIGKQKFMPRFSPAETATRWLASNAAFHALLTRRTRYLRVSYESFIADPRGTLCQLGAFAEAPLVLPSSQLTDSKVSLGDHHIFSGNPMRADTGWLEMRLDDRWKAKLPALSLAQVTAITWPLLRLYGYPLVPETFKNGKQDVDDENTTTSERVAV
jgi:Sulfotransferase family